MNADIVINAIHDRLSWFDSNPVFYGRLAQLVEHMAVNHSVKGSSPLLPFIF